MVLFEWLNQKVRHVRGIVLLVFERESALGPLQASALDSMLPYLTTWSSTCKVVTGLCRPSMQSSALNKID